MIPAVVLSNPYLSISAGILWAVEVWLGETRPLDAGSLPRLVFNLLNLFHRKLTKGTPIMTTTNPNEVTVSVIVDGPTYAAGAVIVDAAKKVIAGEKPQQILTEELGPLIGQMATLSLIPADFASDRASVLNAAALRAVEFEEVIRLSKVTAPVAALAK